MAIPEGKAGDSIDVLEYSEVDEVRRLALRDRLHDSLLQHRQHLVRTVAAEGEIAHVVGTRDRPGDDVRVRFVIVDALAERH